MSDLREYDSALRGFKSGSNNDSGNAGTSSFFSSIKSFVGGGDSASLPFSYRDAAHAVPAEPPTGTARSSDWTVSAAWPTWGQLNSTPDAPWWDTCGLSRMQRLTSFALCIAGAALLYTLSLVHLIALVIRPAKFAIPYCVATILLLVSFGFLHGFCAYTKHLVEPSRRAFSAAIFAATFGTLYVSCSLKSTLLTLILIGIQLLTVLAFIANYLPGGRSGMGMLAGVVGSGLRSRVTNAFS